MMPDAPDSNPPPSPASEAAAQPTATAAASPFIWTDVTMAVLEELWVRDGLSATEVAKLMNISRNMVIGKVHRMRLPPHRAPQKSSAPKKVRSLFGRVVALQKLPELPAPPTTPEVVVDPITIMELHRYSCRFPVAGTGAETLFCGTETAMAPYCGKHREIAYYRR